MELKLIIIKKKIIVNRKFLFIYLFIYLFLLVEKQSDEGEQYDDSIMDISSSLPIEKSSTARYITPAKSG
jgi:hypothetical protein